MHPLKYVYAEQQEGYISYKKRFPKVLCEKRNKNPGLKEEESMGEKRVTMNVIKRYISVLLVAALVVTAIQVPTFAAAENETINMVVGDTITLEAPTTTGDKPEVTKAPTSNDKPEATKAPTSNDKPEATKAPTSNDKPEVTKAPVVTTTPGEATSPEVASAPAEVWTVDGEDVITTEEVEGNLVVTAVKAGEATVTYAKDGVEKVWNIVVKEKTTTPGEATTTPNPTTTPGEATVTPVVTVTPGEATGTPVPTNAGTVTGTVTPIVTEGPVVTTTPDQPLTGTPVPTGTVTVTVAPTSGATGTPVPTGTVVTPDQPTVVPTGAVTVTVAPPATKAPTATPKATATPAPAYGSVKSVKLNAKKMTLAKKASITLTATVNTTKKAYTGKVEWSSSNKKVATVKNGKVTAKAAGKAVIMAKAGGKTAKCTITVSSKKSYKVTYKLNKGKNNGLNPTYVAKNTKTKLYAPTRKGYTFSGWYVGKKKVTSLKVAKKVTVTAKWTKVTVKQSKITKATGASKKLTVKFAKVKGAAGYEVTYSTNKKFKKAATKTVTSKKTTKTVKGLKKGTYYVKVRAYKTDSTGKKVYGKYTSVKKVKVK